VSRNVISLIYAGCSHPKANQRETPQVFFLFFSVCELKLGPCREEKRASYKTGARWDPLHLVTRMVSRLSRSIHTLEYVGIDTNLFEVPGVQCKGTVLATPGQKLPGPHTFATPGAYVGQ